MLFSSNLVRAALLVGSILPAVRSEVFEVIVGGVGILSYEPEFVTAVPGDQVRFVFRQKNHTATQSTFENPCELAPNGFDSGFWPVAADQTDDFPVAELDITSTDPIWVYCRQGNHCSSSGMVFAVNPGERFDAFKAAATGGAAPSTTAASTTAASSSTSAASTGTASPRPSSTGTEHTVIVGDNGLVFNPPSLQAAVGDTVTFEFRPKNHTVTRSSFAAPCVPLGNGFDSGFKPVAAGDADVSTYQITINDTQPIWAYCAQGNHCGQGMVFAINSPETPERNFETFVNTAKALNGTTGGASGGNPYGNGAISHSFTGAGAALFALIVSSLLL